ncbi:sensor histidine kinase [Amycolatopsis japonica]|uniref:sensor histidine kinase n=1 Tax=Amycolatopsis japonica TaxID=208439 RepID=UPI0036711BA0
MPVVENQSRPHRIRAALDAGEQLVGGFATSVLALCCLVAIVGTVSLCLVGVGFLLAPHVLRLVHVIADRERSRLSRFGPELIGPGPGPAVLWDALRRRETQRELVWVVVHGFSGFALGSLGLLLVLSSVRDITFPLWWHLLPEGEAAPTLDLWIVHDYQGSIAVSLLGAGWLFIAIGVFPAMARLQAFPGRRLLRPGPGTDLALRIAHLSAARAAALDAHTTELRRIERALHDGAQNRMVAVNLLVGAARKAASRGVHNLDDILGRAQDATEAALDELRLVVRSILPPVLADRSLADALDALATTSPVPCRLEVDLPGRYAASVEATVYFVVAEALTNIAKHSRATRAEVELHREEDLLRLRITDNGRGGATEGAGSGVGGVRARIEAHEGTFELTSPVGGPTILIARVPCGL